MPSRTSKWALAALPGLGVALLPKLTCPVCWPAYAALLSSMGVGFIDYTPYLLPTLGAFLAITLWALGRHARSRRGYGPLVLGVVGAGVVVTGKLTFVQDVAVYSGSGLLLVAALWNIWPIRPALPLCIPTRNGGPSAC